MRLLLSGSLVFALACGAQPGGPRAEPTKAPSAEPVVFVEVPSEPRRVSPEPTTSTLEPEAEPDPDPEVEQAKRLFQEGVELYNAGDFAGAVEKFEHAWVLEPMPQLVFNIARGREQLGDVAGACSAYLGINSDPDADDRMRDEAAEQRVRLNCP